MREQGGEMLDTQCSKDLACSANEAIESAKRSKLDYESTSDLRLLLAC